MPLRFCGPKGRPSLGRVAPAPARGRSLGEVVEAWIYKRHGSPIIGRGVEEPHTTPLDPTTQTNPPLCFLYSLLYLRNTLGLLSYLFPSRIAKAESGGIAR